MTIRDPGPDPAEGNETLEQFLARSAGAELRYAKQTFEDWQRRVRSLRHSAAKIVAECDSVLTGNPWPDEPDEGPF